MTRERTPRLAAEFAAIPTPVFAWEARGGDLVLVDYNDAAERQTGGRVQSLLGSSARAVYGSQPQMLRGLLAALESAEPIHDQFEYAMLTTGARRMMNIAFIGVPPDLVLAVTEDLTRHHETQRALEESERRYRTLVEGAPDGIVVHRGGRILYANDAFARLVRAEAEAIVGTPVLDHVHPDDRGAVTSRVRDIVAGRVAPLAEERLLRADGSVVHAEITGIPTTFDGEPAVQAIVRDVSERRKAQALFVALSEQSLTGVSVIQNGLMLYANPRCAEMFGYTVSEIIGRRAEDLVAVSSRDHVRAMQRERLERGNGQVHYTFTAVRKDGTLTEIEVFGSVVDLDGTPALVGTLLDASERERMAEQLRQAQKMEAVGQLAGGIAHDFNNILTAIISYADLVLGELAPENPLRADVLEIKDAGSRAALLTKQLLAFSRRQALEMRVLDLSDVIEGLRNMLRRLIDEQITLVIEPARDLPYVLADRTQLEQVLLNLTVNARDAMQHGGRLTVRTGHANVDAAEAEAHPGLRPGSYTFIEVSDTGPGIPPEVQSRIFEPFFTTKPAGRGSGLGLSVVYGIVKQSGGYIIVDSPPGHGSTFRVLLPAMEADATPALTF